MKTRTFFLLCLFMGIGLAQLSAQKGGNGNGTEAYWLRQEPIEIPIFNNEGIEIDVLAGIVDMHFREHFENGVLTRADYNLNGSLESIKTGEVFRYCETGKQTAYSWEPLTGFSIWTERFIGDHGTHVMIQVYVDYSTWEITITNIRWPGDKYWDGY